MGLQRLRHDWVTRPPQPPLNICFEIKPVSVWVMFILGGSPLQFYFALFLDWQIWVGWSLALITTSGRVTVLQKSFAETQSGVSLVTQRLRFPPVSTGNSGLIWEDLTCCGAAKPRVHNHWAQTLKARKLQPLGPYIWEPLLLSERVVSTRQNQRKPVLP